MRWTLAVWSFCLQVKNNLASLCALPNTNSPCETLFTASPFLLCTHRIPMPGLSEQHLMTPFRRREDMDILPTSVTCRSCIHQIIRAPSPLEFGGKRLIVKTHHMQTEDGVGLWACIWQMQSSMYCIFNFLNPCTHICHKVEGLHVPFRL